MPPSQELRHEYYSGKRLSDTEPPDGDMEGDEAAVDVYDRELLPMCKWTVNVECTDGDSLVSPEAVIMMDCATALRFADDGKGQLDQKWQPQVPVALNEAATFVTNVKNHSASEPGQATYKEFVRLLHEYEARKLPLAQLHTQMATLLKPDAELLNEFERFLPNSSPGDGSLPSHLVVQNAGAPECNGVYALDKAKHEGRPLYCNGWDPTTKTGFRICWQRQAGHWALGNTKAYYKANGGALPPAAGWEVCSARLGKEPGPLIKLGTSGSLAGDLPAGSTCANFAAFALVMDEQPIEVSAGAGDDSNEMREGEGDQAVGSPPTCAIKQNAFGLHLVLCDAYVRPFGCEPTQPKSACAALLTSTVRDRSVWARRARAAGYAAAILAGVEGAPAETVFGSGWGHIDGFEWVADASTGDLILVRAKEAKQVIVLDAEGNLAAEGAAANPGRPFLCVQTTPANALAISRMLHMSRAAWKAHAFELGGADAPGDDVLVSRLETAAKHWELSTTQATKAFEVGGGDPELSLACLYASR